jgi:hypothetical protein
MGRSIFSVLINRFRDIIQPSDPEANVKRTQQLPLLSSILKNTDVPRSKIEENFGERYHVTGLVEGKQKIEYEGDKKSFDPLRYLPPARICNLEGNIIGTSLLSSNWSSFDI